MPKRLRKRYFILAAQTESFEPYWTSILIIVMVTFTLFGFQTMTRAVQTMGTEKVTSCLLESKQPAYHRFFSCTKV